MANFHFQLRDRTHIRERTTMSDGTLSQARIEVAKFAGKMLAAHAEEIWKDRDWQIDVTDENGLILYVMAIEVHESAATMSSGVKAN